MPSIRYYFGILELSLAQIKLSMQNSTKLSWHLVDVQWKLGLSLITFEDASIELDPFSKVAISSACLLTFLSNLGKAQVISGDGVKILMTSGNGCYY